MVAVGARAGTSVDEATEGQARTGGRVGEPVADAPTCFKA